MPISELLSWLSAAPVLAGEPLHFNYLPSYRGWSLCILKSERKSDILGNVRTAAELRITRRYAVRNDADRLAVAAALEALSEWARQNPPPGVRVRAVGLPSQPGRHDAGVEDLSISLTVSDGNG